MSSYLTFYLVPKKKKSDDMEPQPMAFVSYSRSSDIYQTIYEELHPAYIGNGDTPNYSEITSADLAAVIKNTKEDLLKTKEQYERRICLAQRLGAKQKDFEDFLATEEYIQEQEQLIQKFESIVEWLDAIEYSDFDKVLMNID